MRRISRLAFPAVFLAAVAAMIWFLHLFTQVEETMSYINWDTSAQVLSDGTEQPFSIETYSNSPEVSGTYRFYGSLPSGLGEGRLLFETSGLDLTLWLDGQCIYQSQVSGIHGSTNLAQAALPLTEDVSGELIAECQILDQSLAMFPPLVRFVPKNLESAESTAFANRSAFPAGASAFALLLVFGVFLLGISMKKADFSLIPLICACFGLILNQLIQSEGSYFLPQSLAAFLGNLRLDLLTLLLLALYLALNRRRLGKYLLYAALWSGAAFLLCLLISFLANGYLSYYILNGLLPALLSGFYSDLLYWLTLWLSLVCALVTCYGVLKSFSIQQAHNQNLLLKNELAQESYQALKERTEASASARHEIRHQLTALGCLCREKKYGEMERLLGQLLEHQDDPSQEVFSENQAVNTILCDAAARAKELDILFFAQAYVPAALNLPESDLCVLLMNMLDNALEAASKTPPGEQRYVRVKLKVVKLYLAVKCENSFDGDLKKDKDGSLLTTKEDTLSHGFGFLQMKKIAEKYQSVLSINGTAGHTFVVQTALRIPDNPGQTIPH